MWIRNLTLLVLVGLSLAQQEDPAIRRLRLRRPRPIDIDNPDGIAEGRPIPLRRIPQGVLVDQLVNERQNTADLLAAALTNDNEQDLDRGQSLQSTDALQSLLATAAEGEDVLEYEDIIDQEPLQRPERPRQLAGRTRRPPGVPRRANRPRDNEKKGQRLPQEAAKESVGTVERYSHTNEDGSFTFGYIAEDGSFREETRGVDCITRGKYGYIDPDGKKREFTYVSGLPCDITDEDNAGIASDEEELQREDPISPNDRFRTSPAVQLDEDEIPDSARPRQRIPAREQQQDFASFQQQPQQPQARPQPTRIRDPATRNRARPGQVATGALQNLLNIANDAEGAPLAPTPAPAVTRPRPQPQTPRPTQARPSSFNFDSALDSFTLSRPALTFDDAANEQPRNNDQNEAAPKPTGPNFSTELVFDPASGTFKTELRQALPSGEEINVKDDKAPALGATQAPTPVPSALPPTARPFTAFAQTTLAPTPRPTQQAASPSSPFEPLTFPSPAPTTPRPAPTPVPTTPRPASPSPQAASPSPSGSFFFQPFPTVGAPRPINGASPSPAQAPASPRPAAPAQPQTQPPATRVPAGTFINFGGQPTFFNNGQPPRPSPFQGTQQPTAPFSVFNTPRPTPPQARPPTPSEAPRSPQSPTPRPVSPSPTPAPSRPTPPAPAPSRPAPPAPTPSRPVTPTPFPATAGSPVTPQVQFGFQPIQQGAPQPASPRPQQPQPQAPRPVFQQGPPQGPPRNRPFTAFSNGTPPQLSGNGQPQQQFRPAQPSFFGQPQLGIPPQVQQQQQQRPLGIPPQLQGQPAQQPGGRFQPFGRPPPQQSSSPFTVFNPAALRGARLFF